MGKVKAIIVGAGLMGRWHACYAARTGADVVAIVDLNQITAKNLQRWNRQAEVFVTLQDALKVVQANVVHICTPISSHLPLAELAINAKCHLLIEKPLVSSLTETECLLALAKQNNCQVSSIHQFRFQRGIQRILKHLPVLGDLVHITYRAYSAGGLDRSDEERRALLFEILPHPISLFYSFLGGTESRPAWNIIRYTNDDLSMQATVKNTQLSIEVSLRARPTCNELIVAGEQATAAADLFHGYSFVLKGSVSRWRKLLAPFSVSNRRLMAAAINLTGRGLRREWAYPGLFELIASAYAAIEQGKSFPVSSDEMMAVAWTIDQVKRTMR